MKKQQLEEVLRDYIREELSEISTTAGAGAYSTPFAFSKSDRDNLATKFLKKMGWKTVKRPNRPSSTKLVDYR
jgi:hypothetical protein